MCYHFLGDNIKVSYLSRSEVGENFLQSIAEELALLPDKFIGRAESG